MLEVLRVGCHRRRSRVVAGGGDDIDVVAVAVRHRRCCLYLLLSSHFRRRCRSDKIVVSGSQPTKHSHHPPLIRNLREWPRGCYNKIPCRAKLFVLK